MLLNEVWIKYFSSHNVKQVDLECEEQDLIAFGKFANALANHKYIDFLDIVDCNIDDEQMRVLADAISKNTSLRFVDFSENPITHKGIEYIANALEQNSSLQVINLSHLSLTLESIQLLNLAFCHSKSLIRIIPLDIVTMPVAMQNLENNKMLLDKVELLNNVAIARNNSYKPVNRVDVNCT